MDIYKELESWVDKGYVLVVINNNRIVHKSKEGGVVALCRLATRNKEILKNSVVMDKIVGKAAAKILVHTKVKRIITLFLSKGARDILVQNKVEVYPKNVVNHILDKRGGSVCLMDKLSFQKSAIEICNIVLKNKDVL